jgi:putative flippase GtrA
MPDNFNASQNLSSTIRAANFRQFIRFAIVGVTQNGVNVGIFAATVAWGIPFLLASVLAAVAALIVSFSLNRSWTFPGRTDQTTARAIRFVGIWITIVLLALPFLAILVDIAHLPKIIAQTIVVVIGAPVSYFAQRRWTFGESVGRKAHA